MKLKTSLNFRSSFFSDKLRVYTFVTFYRSCFIITWLVENQLSNLNGLYCIKSAIIICHEKQTLILLDNREFYKSKIVCTMNLPDIFVNLEQSSGLDCTVQDASYNKDGYFPSEI